MTQTHTHIPNGWRETTVQILVDDKFLDKPIDGNHGGIHPKTEDFVEKGVPFIMASDIIDHKIDYKNCAYIKEQQNNGLQKGFALPGDILLSHKATIGRTAIVGNEYPSITLTPQLTYYRVLNKQELSNYYLFYYFNSPFFQNILGSWAGSGSTRAYLGITDQRKLPILLPPLHEQKAIADILSSLDAKIELLREQNETLEKTAQTIFHEWFGNYSVEESESLPEGWRVGKLVDLGGEITDFVANGSFASLKENVTLYDNKNYALFIRNTDLKSDFQIKVYVDEHSYNFLKKTQLFGGEIIISNVGDVGSVYMCPYFNIPMVLGNNVICLRSKYQSYFYTLFTNRLGQFMINSITGGSAQPKFNKGDFRNLKMIIPPIKLLNDFENIVGMHYKKIQSNNSQIQSLSKTRDTLLPKFMSGEVRVV